MKLPSNFTCADCTLRLLRQADEWSNGYRFWSCADIAIKDRKEFRETCSGHGKYFATKCKCDKLYYGNKCQYLDECAADQDCGAQGKCFDIGGTTLPRKQCYCNMGWFGQGCNKSEFSKFNICASIFIFFKHSLESAIKSTDIDYSLYTSKQLSPDYKVYWRILKEQKEIEVVMVVNGTSWVGFGWRPRKLTAECRNFPLIGEIGEISVAEPTSEPTSESEPSSGNILFFKSLLL